MAKRARSILHSPTCRWRRVLSLGYELWMRLPSLSLSCAAVFPWLVRRVCHRLVDAPGQTDAAARPCVYVDRLVE